jgi:hypothetical protein
MDHAETPEQGHSPAETEAHESAVGHPPIPEEVWRQYRAEDLAAAKRIVGLMLGIFAVGLLLYGFVFMWVESRVV